MDTLTEGVGKVGCQWMIHGWSEYMRHPWILWHRVRGRLDVHVWFMDGLAKYMWHPWILRHRVRGRLDVHEWSMDILSTYMYVASMDTLTQGGGEGWTSMDDPWMVWVYAASMDTLTQGVGKVGHPWMIHAYPKYIYVCEIHGWSMDGLSICGIHGYSNTGCGEGWTSMDGLSICGIHGYSDTGWGEGWTSMDDSWMAWVYAASMDTLTQGGGTVGHPWMIHGWPEYKLQLWHMVQGKVHKCLWIPWMIYGWSMAALDMYDRNTTKKKKKAGPEGEEDGRAGSVFLF